MPNSYTLGQHFEAFIQAQLASGRYNDASEVVRDALRLLEQRERRLAAVDAAIERGLADIEAGRVHDADAVFDELEARYTRLAHERGEM
jgi:antitoxin ParD1/3/4